MTNNKEIIASSYYLYHKVKKEINCEENVEITYNNILER
tara:strand:+ start:7958 stop:8074 length:117 start_codon:yes stop_codon:yes gene_type:complete